MASNLLEFAVEADEISEGDVGTIWRHDGSGLSNCQVTRIHDGLLYYTHRYWGNEAIHLADIESFLPQPIEAEFERGGREGWQDGSDPERPDRRTGDTDTPWALGYAIEYSNGVRYGREDLRRDYPDSPIPPSWFDPANAGERWEDE